MPASAAPLRISRVEMAWVLAVALGVRVLYFWFFRGSPFFAAPILDSAFHHELAVAMAAGDWDAGAPYFRPPLFPWTLGGLYSLFGVNMWWGRALNAALGASTGVAVLLSAGGLGFARRERLLAGVIAAAYPTLLFFEGELLGTVMATALVAWGLWCLIHAWHRPRALRWWLAAGVFWGLAGLARAPLALLELSIVGLAAAARPWSWRRMLATAAPVLLLWSLPAALMSAHGAGLRFPTTQGGINFYAGNHPAADGRGVNVPELRAASGGVEFPSASVRVVAETLGRPITTVEASSFWWGRGFAWWTADPGAAVGLTLKKALYLIHGFEIPNNRSLYEGRMDVPWLGWVFLAKPGLFWPAGLLIPLAVVGVVHAGRGRWTPVLVTAATVTLPLVFFFVCARFRVPALPALALLAVLGINALSRRRGLIWVVFIATYVLANAPWPSAVRSDLARESLARAEASLNAGRYEQAAEAYRNALKRDPGEGRAHLGLAAILERQEDPSGAVAHLDQASALLPGYWAVESFRAGFLDRQGRTEDAVPHMERAVSDFPGNPALWGHLGLALEALGEDERSWEALERSIGLGSLEPEVWNSAARFRRLNGDRAGAARGWDRALRLDPKHFKSRLNRGLLLGESGDREAALQDLQMAVSLAPDAQTRALAEGALSLLRQGSSLTP